ncbi:type II toxin-antitoxin system VapC family toxin [Rhodopseudomonas palustris]|uniref:type II toxin-antitoxin system VapC family toxin n=1 Tax=Rhodopseudomonas palustris TaxID=1076 RepID=UPI002ACE3ABA|nr:type II toxin-antitoxin system VapC family toxin [Rhodopseudomonas palustris]WQH01279.1 type II toxin-antitoxin system VapC family toxin [Rhodopseudomonas palustris]
MIVVDTSALIAILFDEPQAEACARAIRADGDRLISAGTVTECLVVAARRNADGAMARLIHGAGFEIVSVTAASARRAGEAYKRWGKGRHPAGLNFGDCFAYALAQECACPLLFIGDDFSKTDIESALQSVSSFD